MDEVLLEARLTELSRNFAEKFERLEQQATSVLAAREVQHAELEALLQEKTAALTSLHAAYTDHLRHSQDMPSGSDDDELRDDDRYWNLYAVALASWKSCSWPRAIRWNPATNAFQIPGSGACIEKVWQHSARHWTDTLAWGFLAYSVFPIAYLVILISVLADVLDEGLSMRSHIYGDGFYQSPAWRYSRTAESRADNFSDNLLGKRPPNEIEDCLDRDFLLPFDQFNPTSNNYSRFWELFVQLRQRDGTPGNRTLSWAFTHCMPWEYATLCGTLHIANQEVHGPEVPMEARPVLAQTLDFCPYLPATLACYPAGCYPTNWHQSQQMSAELWWRLSARANETLAAAAESRVPFRPLHAGSPGPGADVATASPSPASGDDVDQLGMWVVSRNLFDAKSLDYTDDDVSMFLYQGVHYVYHFSIGESPIIEVATIVCLSLFLFYSVILTETQQVMHQVTLNCGLRCYEAALLGNRASGRHHPLVASVNMVKAEGRFGLLRLYLLFVATEAISDVLIALRVISLSEVVMCSIMFVTLQHGVIQVIFSVLAIAFVMDVDDKFQSVLVSCGWTETALYRDKVQPYLSAHLAAENKPARSSAAPGPSNAARVMQGTQGHKVFLWLSMLLTTALFADYLFWSLLIATESSAANMAVILDDAFLEFMPPPHLGLLTMAVIYPISAVNTIWYEGVVVIPAVAQFGLALVWVYGVMRNFTFLTLLANSNDVTYNATFLSQFMMNCYEDSLLIVPALAIHVGMVFIRPLPMLLLRRMSSVSTEDRAGVEVDVRVKAAE